MPLRSPPLSPAARAWVAAAMGAPKNHCLVPEPVLEVKIRQGVPVNGENRMGKEGTRKRWSSRTLLSLKRWRFLLMGRAVIASVAMTLLLKYCHHHKMETGKMQSLRLVKRVKLKLIETSVRYPLQVLLTAQGLLLQSLSVRIAVV